MGEYYNCIDSGSRYCPCDLADSLDCISCSQLRGRDFCDCNWNGVCILYEYYMNNKEICSKRPFYEGIVLDKKIIEENIFLLKIKTNSWLVKELDVIGSYVFINKFDSNPYYDTPMSIFDISKDCIYIVYQEIGPKTKGIDKGDKINIKGPYWNGIIGDGKLSNIKNSSVLIFARGIGQSAIVIPIRKLMENNNEVFLFLDKGKINSLYCLDFIKENDLKVEEISLFTDLGRGILLNFLEDNPVDILFSSGSEMVHREIKIFIDSIEKPPKWFITNNNILCCGEGICGSCIRKIYNGDRIKTCKTVIDPINFY